MLLIGIDDTDDDYGTVTKEITVNDNVLYIYSARACRYHFNLENDRKTAVKFRVILVIGVTGVGHPLMLAQHCLRDQCDCSSDAHDINASIEDNLDNSCTLNVQAYINKLAAQKKL